MPLPISTAAIAEKNKLAANSPWLLLLEILYPNETPIRVVWNTENIVWNGVTWNAVHFELGDQSESSEGEIPTVSLTVIDIERRISPHLDRYDGGVGASVCVRVVHADHLDAAEPELESEFEILDAAIDHLNAIRFTLGAENLTNYRSPADRFLKAHCRYKRFAGPRCGYAGGQTSCDRTFAQCRAYGNQARFGGFPGIGQVGYFK